MYINSTALTGCIAMSMYSSFLSILAGVLFEVSQTDTKSNKPLCITRLDSKLSTTCFAFDLVIASFGSNKNGLTMSSSLSLMYTISLATLILSNALAVGFRVFCPNTASPLPGMKQLD